MTHRPSIVSVHRQKTRRELLAATLGVAGAAFGHGSPAYGQRVFGLDTSSATGRAQPPSLAQWQNAFNDADGDGVAYKFAFVRSNHGIPATGGTDDSEFYTNISRGTTAGLLVGSYNYIQADVNTAVNEASHYLDRAGMYMKPGYLLPVFDLEGSGSASLSQTALTTWSIDYMNTIFAAKGIYPIVYTSSSFNNDEVTASVAWTNTATTPKTGPKTYQWLARPSGNLQTGQPGAATNYPNPYGVWDPNFVSRTNSRDPAVNPWAFWQNGSGSPNGFLIDNNAANGNIEFVKDFLVPALWTNAGSGDWGTISNWNSDNPIYVAGNTATGPAPRLPNNSNLDWVKLQNSGGGTVTISSGAQTVRKFYTQQPLNISGGSLSVGYVPGSGGQSDVPSEFKAAVTLSAGAAYSAHTTVVDGGGGTFNVNGGTVTFKELQLQSHASNSGNLVVNGTATFAQTGGTMQTIRTTGSLAQAGNITLSAGTQTLSVNNGSSSVDLNVRAPITGPGRLNKAGAGTMHVALANTYSGGTTVSGGVVEIAADDRLGPAPGGATPGSLVLDGGTIRTGAQINSISLSNAGSNYTSFPTLAIAGAGADVMAASANVLAGVRTISVTSGGSGYVNQFSTPPVNGAGTFVDIVGGGGTGATAFATVAGGVVTGITVTNAGSGYTSMPTIHISSTAISGVAGGGATAAVNGITIQNVALNDGGFDYNTPTISFIGGGGSGAAASAAATPNWSIASNRGIQLGAGGGTLYQTSGSTLTYGGIITGTADGAITKAGSGTLVLSGSSTYTGVTNVSAGTLILEKDAALGAAAGDTFMLAGSTSTVAFRSASSLNYATQEYLFTDGTGSGGSSQIDNLGGNNTFGGSIGFGGATVGGIVTGSISVSAGSLTVGGGLYARSGFASTARNINKNGSGTLTLTGDSSLTPASASALPLAGSTLTINGGTVDLQSPNAASANVPGITTYKVTSGTSLLNTAGTLSGATINVDAAGVFSQTNGRLLATTLNLPNGAAGTIGASGTAASVLAGLNLTGTGKLTLNRTLVLDYSGVTPADLQRQRLLSGRNGGTWNGAGIASSLAAGDAGLRMGIGYAEASDLLGLTGIETATWSGATVDATSLLFKPTWYGDANLNGMVDLDDYVRVDRGMAKGLTGWFNGDFNYDDLIDSADYGLIDRVYVQQGAPLSPEFLAMRESQFGAEYVQSLLASVPEPSTTLAAVSLAAFVLPRRRQRRQ